MKKRLANLLGKDGKTFILAMDHAMLMDVGMKLKNPREIVASAMANGADALLTTAGTAEYCINEIGKSGLLIRGDCGTSTTHWSGKAFINSYETASVEMADRLGADGIINMLFTHMKSEDEEERTVARTAKNADLCSKYGMVLCVETVPGGFAYPENQTIDSIGFSSRLACEMGADIVKSLFVNDKEYQSRVIETCYRPLIVLGGGAAKTDEELLSSTKAAIDMGCNGVAYGRVVWNHKKIDKICQALSMIIHENASVEQAMELLR
jgi:DhnA family fructose-bisphosphate aldolase class Ia